MAEESSQSTLGRLISLDILRSLGVLSHKILQIAHSGTPKKEFLKRVMELILNSLDCNAMELRLIEHGRLFISEIVNGRNPEFITGTAKFQYNHSGEPIPCRNMDSDLDRICNDVFRGRVDLSLPYYSARGSFYVNDTTKALELSSETCKWAGGRTIIIGSEYKSLAVIPLSVNGSNLGLLLLKSKKRDHFSEPLIEFMEDIVRILSVAILHRRAQVALRERVKELTCLYGIAKSASLPGISLNKILLDTVELMPPGWLYPDLAQARIVLDGREYKTPGFKDSQQKLTAGIVSGGISRGTVEVAYSRHMPELDEGPFLREERDLIDAIAREISIIIERRRVEQERQRLQEQLRHADRLATIGQLAAGVAHELNEPLGSILGFAQLAKKNLEKDDRLSRDVEKIEAASLHAREVIRKLMIFSRQAHQQKAPVNLNEVAKEGLLFLESRCSKAGITLIKELRADLPEITADKNQLNQILVNLVVNAIQAMPDGGTIKIKTDRLDGGVILAVSDTGTGIDQSIQDKIFMPFFTTKDINEGTGLGLAVVHGIVASHGGTIKVDSACEKGTTFEIYLPLKNSRKTTGDGDDNE